MPTFKDQQEINWASIQSFRTLCSKVTEELQEQLSNKDIKDKSVENNKHISDTEITDTIRGTWKWKCLFIFYWSFNRENFRN